MPNNSEMTTQVSMSALAYALFIRIAHLPEWACCPHTTRGNTPNCHRVNLSKVLLRTRPKINATSRLSHRYGLQYGTSPIHFSMLPTCCQRESPCCPLSSAACLSSASSFACPRRARQPATSCKPHCRTRAPSTRHGAHMTGIRIGIPAPRGARVCDPPVPRRHLFSRDVARGRWWPFLEPGGRARRRRTRRHTPPAVLCRASRTGW